VSTAYPTAAPETGGGGTAGLQDGVLFGAGGVAVLVGFGTLAYRRRLSRKFATDDPAPGGDPARGNPGRGGDPARGGDPGRGNPGRGNPANRDPLSR
jgi:hypothetical protein